MKKITAAVIRDPRGDFTLEEAVLGDLQKDEILVRIQACGVCHTDAKFREILSLPAVLGHEGTGIVEETGADVTGIRPGDRVILSYPWCGACAYCRQDEPYLCEQMIPLSFSGARLDGSRPVLVHDRPVSSAFFQQSAFASHVITPARGVVPVASDLPVEMLAALPCGIQTGAGTIMNSLRFRQGSTLVVFGAGAVGLSAVMAARIAGAGTIIVVDRIPSRLELALELGASHVLNFLEGEVVKRVRDILPGGAAYAFDTSATVAGLKDAIDSIGQGGRVGIVSFPEGGREFPFSTKTLFIRLGTLQGIIQGHAVPRQFIPRLLDWHAQGLFPYERLITAYAFADINRAFADAESGSAVKPVLIM